MNWTKREAETYTDPLFMFVALMGCFGLYGIPTCYLIGKVIAGQIPYSPEMWIVFIWGGLITIFGFIAIKWHFQAKKFLITLNKGE